MNTTVNRLGFVTDASTGRQLGRVHKIEQNYQVNTGTHAYGATRTAWAADDIHGRRLATTATRTQAIAALTEARARPSSART